MNRRHNGGVPNDQIPSRRLPLRSIWLTATALVLAPVAAAAGATGCPESPYRSAKPLVIAHASGTYFGPPNTIEMQRAAVAAGADVVDADVRVTKDGALVASHDDNLAATTNGTGSIAAHTLADLERLDAAYTWRAPNGEFTLRGHNVRIPTIEAFLQAFPHRQVSLEFKVTGGERTMCDLIRRLHRTRDVYISAATDLAIDRFKPICPEVTTTVTDALVPVLQAARASGSSWCSPAPIGQPPYSIGTRKLIDAASVRWDHDHGMAVYTWTIDDPTTLAEVAAAGVDGVYTSRADIARKVFDQLKRRQSGRGLTPGRTS